MLIYVLNHSINSKTAANHKGESRGVSRLKAKTSIVNFQSNNIPIESQLSTRTTIHDQLSFPRQSTTATFVKLNWCRCSHVREQI